MDDDSQADDRPQIHDTAGLEGALEAAYGMVGKGSAKDAVEDASILIQLQKKGVDAPRVLLRDAAEDDTPVVRPGTREAPGGRYQTVGEVARGGVGVILKCRDVDLGRDVAMKVLQGEHADNAQLTERFVEEAQISGQLQHPGIVPVYELGLTKEKRPYFTMKFVKGDTLAALLSNRESPTDGLSKMLGIFQQVCMTVAYAHSRGVIHRDLKPANVIIGAFGEVMVVDWGFAKVLAHGGVADERRHRAERGSPRTIVHTLRSGSKPGSGSDSVAGSVMGTPAYMPPEQALGDIDSMDARSDVFGLGAILCEILTGAPPYVQGDLSPIVQAAQGRLDDAFRRLDECMADEALVSLCKRCLDVVPAKRPSDGGAVGRAVANHLQGVEDRAQRATIAAITARRTRKWAVAAAVALLVGLGVSIVAWRETETQRELAEGARATLAARNSKLELVAYASALRRAADAIAAGDLGDVAGILEQTEPRHRGFEFDWLRMQGMAPPKPRTIATQGGRVSVIELSADASVVVVADTVSCVSAWDVASGRSLWRVPDLGHSLAWAPDGGSIVALHLEGRLTVVDAKTGEERARATVRTPAYRLAVSRDGRRLATTSLDGWVSVLRMDTLAVAHEFEVDRSIREICCSPDGTRLLVTLADQAVILDAATGRRGHSFKMVPRSGNPSRTVPATPTSVDWSSAGDRVLVCFEGGGSGIWFAATGLLDHELQTHSRRNINAWSAYSGRFCDATSAITVGWDDRVRVHDVGSGTRRAMFVAGGSGTLRTLMRGVRWRGPGTPVLTWGACDRLFVWDVDALSPGEDIEEFSIASNVVSSPDASTLFYVTKAGELVRRDRKTDQVTWSRPVGKTSWQDTLAPMCCRYLPKVRAVVVVSRDLQLTLVDAENGSVRQTIHVPESIVSACSLHRLYAMGIDVSADETRVACAVGTIYAGRDRTFAAPVLAYDLGTEPRVRAVGRHMASAIAVCFVPDDHLVSGGSEGDVTLWDLTRAVPSGQEPVAVRKLSPSRASYVESLDVSSNGRLLAVGRLNGRVHVYDLETGGEQTAGQQIALHDTVKLVTFDPQKDRLLAIGKWGALALVDLSGVTLLRTSLAFARERNYDLARDRSHLVATAQGGGAVHVRPLRLPPGSAAVTVTRPKARQDISSQGHTAARQAWGSSAGRDEAREKLRTDSDLPENVRAAALEAVSYLGENYSEILRRVLRIAGKETVTAADRKTLTALLHRGLDATRPGSLIHGAFLTVLTASESPAGESAARNGKLAEAVIAAHETAENEKYTGLQRLLLPRAVLAARRGDRVAATSCLNRAKAFLKTTFIDRDKPEPQLFTEWCKEVEALLAR